MPGAGSGRSAGRGGERRPCGQAASRWRTMRGQGPRATPGPPAPARGAASAPVAPSRARPGQSSAASSRSSSARGSVPADRSRRSCSGSFSRVALWRGRAAASSLAAGGLLGSFSSKRLGFVRAFRQRLLAQLAQLLEAAADLAALLGLVAAHGVEALEVEGGERVGLLPAGSRSGGRCLGAASNSATSIRSARSPFQKAMARRRAIRASISVCGTGLLDHPGGELLQLRWRLVLEHEMLHGGEAVGERIARGTELAFLGDGSARAGAVAAGGLDLGGGPGAGLGHGRVRWQSMVRTRV